MDTSTSNSILFTAAWFVERYGSSLVNDPEAVCFECCGKSYWIINSWIIKDPKSRRQEGTHRTKYGETIDMRGGYHCYVTPHQISCPVHLQHNGLAGNFRTESLIRSRVGVMAAILSWVSREQAQLVWRRAAHLHTAAQRNISSIVGLRCTPCRSRQSCLYLPFSCRLRCLGGRYNFKFRAAHH